MVDNYYKNGWAFRSKELLDKELIKENQKDSLVSMINSPDKENLVLAKELIRLKISEALVEGLNQGQTNAFIEIISFFRDPQHDGIVLKGYAGTGKTFLVKRLIEYITTSYPHRKIAVTAPTNKAVKVLFNNSPFVDNSHVFADYHEPDEQIVFSTIHKLLGLKEEITDIGEQKFTSGKDVELNDYKYLIVDEVSMLNDELFLELMKFKDKIKFIFMGDPAQIPPINKEHCLPFMEECTFDLKKLELTEIMRQKGEHAIVDASMLIRQNLTLANPLPSLSTTLNKKEQGIICLDAKTQRSKIREYINQFFNSDQYKENPDFIKIIAWRNKSVNYLNDVVRQCIYGEDKETYNVGDTIVANKPLFSRGAEEWGRQKYKIKGNTSDEFIITKIKLVNKKFKERYMSSPGIDFEGSFWKLEVIDYNKEWCEPIYVIHEDWLTGYLEKLNELKQWAKQTKSRDCWVMYFNMLKWSDNITFNYAITAHKSQGSTYDNVILIEEDLDFNKKIVERNRIKYTAYTRASDKLFVLRK